MSELTPAETIDSIRSLIGFIRRLYGKGLPDNFNVTIKVRHRYFQRMDIEELHESKALVVEKGVFIKG